MPLLNVNDLSVSYNTASGVLPAVAGVSFSVEQGQTLGIVGESGAGKSSLALALMRILPRNVAAFTGHIELEGIDIYGLSDEDYRRKVRWRKIAMVFQGAMDSLNPVIKVGRQVAEPLLLNHGTSRREAMETADKLLEMVMLSPDVASSYPHELSGGMKQRVMIAMALVLEPKLIILDEPTSALDVMIQAQIMNLLKRFKSELQLTSIFITHDLALASDLCDTIAVMYAGHIVEQGSAEEILLDPRHPYSQKLLASIPRLTEDVAPQFITGIPPEMTALPAGCHFQPRCHLALDRCLAESPPVFRQDTGRVIKCWLHSEET
jgi:peptide/nickel transport system ATP-binding protein